MMSENLKQKPDQAKVIDLAFTQAEAINLLEQFSDPQQAVYQLLFWAIGLDDSAVVAIPFLERDTDYEAMPGHQIRLNNLNGIKPSDPIFDQLLGRVKKSLSSDLVVADVTKGIPLGNKTVDLFIASHGVLLSEVFEGPKEVADYYDQITRVTKSGGYILSIDDSYDAQGQWQEIAEHVGATKIQIKLTPAIIEVLTRKGLNSRYERPNSDDLADFLPIMMDFPSEIVLLKMP